MHPREQLHRATGVPRAVRLAFVVLVPTVVATLLVFHPAGSGERLLGAGHHYYWLHIVLLFGFPLTALVVAVLLHGSREPFSWMSRVALFTYAVTYAAYDALAGITIAVYTMEAEQASEGQVGDILAQRGPLSGDGIIGQVAATGRWAWVAATLLAAIALYRAGVRIVALLPLVASGWLLQQHDHVPPWGWTPFAALLVAVLLIEVLPRRPARAT